ncbi:helix-turn-helix domain-containing protein [Nocardioides hwasunensis]|uniref:Helix-turn-helix transcriptional regulator n=1 Tax=Nocardioides hwasunensis TaxID=397258 RepID=A0ABR8MH06_9ACTN|nr:helix-turn-helix transcriptional regulator [Nocardioides hwasunensis]MBD3914551.1 helix-turn-helix transcriptional regulator [Nocardioides hwasunensis]
MSHPDDQDPTDIDPTTWDSMANWSEEEREYWRMGPFPGGIPGLVRRIRRILDVSQRGLAALLGVSQSVVARWETARTSPRATVLERLLRMARLEVTFSDEETGEQVEPMRADGVRKHGGSRYPAHTDLRVTGWWIPRSALKRSTIERFTWRDRSRARKDPAISYSTSAYFKERERTLWGTPDDHPALHQQVAEAMHLEEVRADRLRELRERDERRLRGDAA